MEERKQAYFRVLSIAGSDSSGGAGIQADLKTFSALGCYGMSAITALTAQNTVTVKGLHDVPAGFVEEQIRAVLEDVGVDAVKIGMLSSSSIVKVVADCLREFEVKRIVLDPVMISKSGALLLQNDAVDVLREELMPLAEIITPNVLEAGVLSEITVAGVKQLPHICRLLVDQGAQSVLIKGGHFSGEIAADCLLLNEGDGRHSVHWFEAGRIDTKNTHGTGCTLSSAIAALLARGYGLKEAVAGAKDYVSSSIRAAAEMPLGRGHAPLHHFHAIWPSLASDHEVW